MLLTKLVNPLSLYSRISLRPDIVIYYLIARHRITSMLKDTGRKERRKQRKKKRNIETSNVTGLLIDVGNCSVLEAFLDLSKYRVNMA